MTSTDAPIGIFDSGFGGLTVARAVMDQLPQEDLIYLGDTARAPYGDQPIADVREYSLECLDHLIACGVKALVIACNSGSAATLRDARERYSVPVIEVILPAARRAAATTRNGRVGVICTDATANSMAYDDAFVAASGVELRTVACPKFVPYVEAGITGGPKLLAAAEDYLTPLRAIGIDTLILGCTHYPLLAGAINYVLGDQVTLVSSAEECAQDVYSVLTRAGLIHDGPRPARYRFLTTGHPQNFAGIGRRLIGDRMVDVEQLYRLGSPALGAPAVPGAANRWEPGNVSRLR